MNKVDKILACFTGGRYNKVKFIVCQIVIVLSVEKNREAG